MGPRSGSPELNRTTTTESVAQQGLNTTSVRFCSVDGLVTRTEELKREYFLVFFYRLRQ